MKKYLCAIASALLLNACAPAVGTQAWCEQIKSTPKGDVTPNEMIDFAKHCILKTNHD